jgi:uroporphyrinogen decarboxylase
MTSRERILITLSHKEPDRIPIDFGGTSCSTIHRIAYKNLMELMGFKKFKEDMYNIIQQVVRPDSRLLKLFGNDTYLIMPGLRGNWELKIKRDDKYSYFTDEWGAGYRMPKNGYFYDFYTNPLTNATLNDLKKYKFPDPADKNRIGNLKNDVKYAY